MTFTGTLYPFQAEAVDLMVERQRLLVGYVMGAGKTVLTLAACERIRTHQPGPVLVVVPAPLKFQWQQSIGVFTDASSQVIHGDPKQRKAQYAQVPRLDYTVLTYEQVVNDWLTVKNLPRIVVAADEVTAIKNHRAKRSRRVKRLQAPYLFGLTGQPIENRPEELFSIMQWIDPEVLGRFDLFDKAYIVRSSFGGVQRYKNLPALRQNLAPVMIRKTREEIADQLPKVSEATHLIPFDEDGAKVYRHITRELLSDLAQAAGQLGRGFNLYAHYHGSDESENYWRGRIMSKMTCLRMLCDSPDLLRLSAERYGSTDLGGSAYAADLKEAGHLDALKSRPKFDYIVDLLTDDILSTAGAKAVVFSFFTPTLSWMAAALSRRGIDTALFTGKMDAKDRDAEKVRFQTEPTCRVFLSSDAGGHGVDLPQANFLINLDLPWSAGKLDQRNARIIRLSSTWGSVSIINTLMEGSLEERQLEMLRTKSKVASAWIDGKGIDAQGGLSLDTQSLTEFLRTATV